MKALLENLPGWLRSLSRRLNGCLLVLSFSMVAGCSTNEMAARLVGTTPAPAKSEYFESEEGTFVLSRNEAGRFDSCNYLLRLKLVKPIASTLYLRTRFPNPEDDQKPFVVDVEIQPGQADCKMESSSFNRLRSGKAYKLETLVYDSPERKTVISSHTQYLVSPVSLPLR